MSYVNHIVIVVFRIHGRSVDCSFRVADIVGEPGKTCHDFNYGIHLAHAFVDGLLTPDLLY